MATLGPQVAGTAVTWTVTCDFDSPQPIEEAAVRRGESATQDAARRARAPLPLLAWPRGEPRRTFHSASFNCRRARTLTRSLAGSTLDDAAFFIEK